MASPGVFASGFRKDYQSDLFEVDRARSVGHSLASVDTSVWAELVSVFLVSVRDVCGGFTAPAATRQRMNSAVERADPRTSGDCAVLAPSPADDQSASLRAIQRLSEKGSGVFFMPHDVAHKRSNRDCAA